ncbi:hypothetical protein [Curtobacterium sp. ISL-83]|uniref:hypothetical protein n=1 Tax=Curtobacterium sp. ISL-83 TaxID=2819145 RepID=UPI001BE6E273|nr:hypothetical protein [Curtobacterium sp. ISL-83]MBT2502993.1 hypothetical protein [Curtobacterium sp. ISL-83]
MSTDVQHEQDSPAIDPDVVAALAETHVRSLLIKAADQVEHVRSLVVPGGAQPSDGQPHSSSTEPSFPIRVDPLEASDRVYAHLLNWVRYWSAELQIDAPVTAKYAWSTDGGPQGFRSSVTPQGAYGLTANLATWLLIHHDSIRRQPGSADYLTSVDSMLWHLRERFPMEARPARPVVPRPCPVCGSSTMNIERRSESVTDIAIVCSYCRFEGDAKALMKERNIRVLLTDIRVEEAPPAAEWWTKKQAIAEMRLTQQTLNRYIQHEGLPTHTADGVVYVRADDVRELWRAKQVRRLATVMRRPVGAARGPETATAG